MTERVPVETKKLILAAMAAGERHADIAARFGVHRSYPGILKSRGFREDDVTILTPHQRRQIANRYAAGHSIKVIAADYKISSTYVGLIAFKAGIPRRKNRSSNVHNVQERASA